MWGLPLGCVTSGKSSTSLSLTRRLSFLVEDVEDVTDVVLESLDTETRKVTGEIQFTSKEGEDASVEL